MPVSTPFGSACIAGSKNGEVRAVHAAEIATAAFLGSYNIGWVISLGIKCGRKHQNTSGAKLYTEPAPFTAFDIDGNEALGHESLLCRRSYHPHVVYHYR